MAFKTVSIDVVQLAGFKIETKPKARGTGSTTNCGHRCRFGSYPQYSQPDAHLINLEQGF